MVSSSPPVSQLDSQSVYQHVVLSHMPQSPDMCLPADPTLLFLEFYGLITDEKRRAKVCVLCLIFILFFIFF